MSTHNDGGPAFPMTGSTANWDAKSGEYVQQYGMSLRDYFAGQALQSLTAKAIVDPVRGHLDWRTARVNLAEGCYGIADAMLAARERKEEQP